MMNTVKDGVKAIVLNGDRILLFLRDNIPSIRYPGYWHVVGGAIEDGETPEQAVIRELGEEATYVPKKFYYFDQQEGDQGDTVYDYVFYITDAEEKLFIHKKGEGQTIAFFTIDDALRLEKLTPGSQTLIEKIKKAGLCLRN